MPKVILCDCAGSQSVDAARIGAALQIAPGPVHTDLCGAEQGVVETAMQQEDEVVIACGQMAAFFSQMAADLDLAAPLCIDIRDRAGWGGGDAAGAKMAALLADGMAPAAPERVLDITSSGACLVVGAEAVALPAARQLSGHLAVTLLLSDAAEDFGEEPGELQVLSGRLTRVTGALGGFDIVIDAARPLIAAGRGALAFGEAGRAEAGCDIILDLRGEPALVPAPEKRDGYLRADPGDPLAVAAAVQTAATLIGTFEKPLYVRLEEALCAHSRSGQVGCDRCLTICPTGAITPDGDHVAVDPLICAGCGSCSAVCPSGAIRYDAPPVDAVFARMRRLADTYLAAGGAAPRLLVHDDFGAEMIRLAARFGTGLPPDVIPMEMPALAGFGHAEMLAALGLGFADLSILVGPRTEREGVLAQLALTDAIAGAGCARLLDLADPDDLGAAFDPIPGRAQSARILPQGGRREVARLAGRALRGEAVLPLPDGAPYGAVLVDAEACTLCLSCSSQCPSGALLADDDHPRLRFQEEACLQCGICARVCPEDAIALKPQLDLTAAALSARVMKEEDPAECLACGKPFGVKSTIERIAAKLEGHSMFAGQGRADLIRMCDDCRVGAQYHAEAQPFASAPRPKVRTTEDELAARDKKLH